MRSGRKRKARPVTLSGQKSVISQIIEADKKDRLKETETVLRQPHRRGSSAPECATALGRFWLAMKTENRVLLEAGEAYAGLVRRWRAAWGAANGQAPEEGAGSGEGPSDATVRSWRRQIDKIEAELNRVGCVIRFAVNRLVIDDRDLPDRQAEQDAIVGLRIIALELQLLGPLHPFR